MFSKGQLIFGIIVLAFTYRKDLKLHKAHYKGTLWVLLAFLSFIGMIVAIKVIFT